MIILTNCIAISSSPRIVLLNLTAEEAQDLISAVARFDDDLAKKNGGKKAFAEYKELEARLSDLDFVDEE